MKLCGYFTGYKKELCLHEKVHHEGKGNTCNDCGKNHGNLSSLKFHIKIDHLRQLLKCSLCDLSFRSKDVLRRHTESHGRGEANSSQYICPVCDFESKDQEKVMKHFRDKHNQVKARAKELDKKFGGGVA